MDDARRADRPQRGQAASEQAVLRAAQRVAGLGHWTAESVSGALALSDEARAVLGIAADVHVDFAGLVRHLHAEDQAWVEAQLTAAFAGQTTVDLCARITTELGKTRAIRIRAMPRAALGVPGRGLIGTVQDVTNREATERSLRASEERFRRQAERLGRIIDTSSDIICMINAEGTFQEVSAACERVLGYATGELLGRSYLEFIVAEDRDRARGAWERIATQLGAGSFESRFVRRDGAIAHLIWSARWAAFERCMICVARDETPQRLANEAARVISDRLQLTLDTMTDGFFTLDPQWRITYLNKAGERIARTTREAIVGRALWDAFPELVGTRFAHEYQRAAQTREPISFVDYYPPLGLWLESRAFPSGAGLALYLRDVTDVHESQRALRESEERFRLIADATTDGTWDLDLATGVVWSSARLRETFGYSAAEGDTSRWAHALHPDDRDETTASLARAISSGATTWEHRYRIIRPDGREVYVRDHALILRDADGKAMRMLGGVKDLTAQKEAQDRLREQAHLLDGARDAIHVRDLQHRVSYWNRSAELLYGWQADEVRGQSAESLLYAEPAHFRSAMGQLLERGQWTGEIEKVARNGRRLTVEARWTLLRDVHGRPHRVLVLDTDVTERRHLERQLVRSQRLDSLGRLAGGIAHDLNNVFTPILMSTELLEGDDVPDEERREVVEAIRVSARRGADMVSQLMTFTRGKESRFVTMNLEQPLTELRRIATETFPKSIRVETSTHPSLWPVVGDATQLHQVMLNLCVNARDAMPQGGTLRLAAANVDITSCDPRAGEESPPGPYVMVEVADEGTGMSRDVMERIFDPFFTTKELGKGTGLGLSTSLSIVKRHRGFMTVDSAPGTGTTFRFFVPAIPGARVEESHPEDAQLRRGRGEVILIVDDEAPIRAAASRALAEQGYATLCAEHGADGIAKFDAADGSVAAIVMDMMMPVMDGLAAAAAIRSRSPDIPIIATSGVADEDHAHRIASAGLKVFLPKPYTTKALIAALQAHLPSEDAHTCSQQGAERIS